MSNPVKTKKALFIITYLFIILGFFTLIEAGLRLFNYGYNTRPFVKPGYFRDVYVNNFDFLDKYYSRVQQFGRLERTDIFDAVKSTNILRGFIIGESTPQGFPFEFNQSFAKITESALDKSAQADRFEIINLSHSAMTSYYVLDAAKKALEYEPDFIVIYSGHNEYYGTVSSSTGGNRFFKKLFLNLKELKLFQLIFSLISPKKTDIDKTLMANQWKNLKFITDPGIDKTTTQDYIRNIDSVVKLYAGKKIPVIIMEPVCNLSGMPPFAGNNDTNFLDFIRRYYTAIISKDPKQMKAVYNERTNRSEMNGNANILYLDSLYDKASNPAYPLSGFLSAKDADIIPFRAKSGLIGGLRNYISENRTKYANLYYIPLFDELTNRYGVDIMGNRIFIDHVHFNMEGQLAVSRLLTEKLARIFQYNGTEMAKIETLYKDEKNLLKQMHYTPLNELLAYGKIKTLTADSPFKEMPIPYLPAMSILSNNEIVRNKELSAAIILNANDDSMLDLSAGEKVLEYYKQKNDGLKYYDYLMSFFTLYPGSHWPYLLLARYYYDIANQKELSASFYEMAYLLSDKNENIYKEFKEVFPEKAEKLKNSK